ncbi:protein DETOXIFICATION 44, chloroplastic [Daucus carota subsp. sativus]|uniref:protein DETOXIFICATION 44, chloroplastic n=1 Tax=Daucus carota subsp. sativus TaxID=79200 RepID=UPI0007EFEDAA|nr:PREDICTED: protein DETOXIFICATION 44, chloroplastic [Daucus carota subsp. sativus]
MKGVSLVSYHHLFSTQSPFHRHHHHHHRSLTPPHKHLRVVYTTHPTCSFRLKSSENENDSTTHLLKPDDTVSSSQSESGPASFVQRSLSFLRDGFKLDEIGGEIVSIALPAVLALAADPLTSLVDTAFVGHLGSVELAAVGVSASVFNLVSKLFNVPLLNVTTAFVAEEQAFITKGGDKPLYSGQNGLRSKKVLPSVSTSLILAATIGIAEAVALSAGSGFLMNTMGIPFDSPMRVPAEQFLTLRAFGAPPIVIALAAQGAFRGFKDTKTPLYAVGAGNLLNALLDPILIFFLSFGIGGAAISTVISEYLIAFILLWKLNEKVSLVSPKFEATKVFRYLKSGGFLIGRTIAVLVTMTVATSMAARDGPVPVAGYQICLEVWLALSLLNDALAIAGQALLASCYSEGNYDQAREVIYRVLKIGITAGISLTVFLLLGFGAISSLFTNDSEVLEIAKSGTLFVAGSQIMNALAFVLDGLYYGVSDFEYAAYSMALIGLISSLVMLAAAPMYGLAGVWIGLYLFMTLRVVAGIWRLSSKSGPWKSIWSEE